MCLNLFPSIIFATFRYFFESPVYGRVPMTPFCHHFVTILSPFCHHFVTILSPYCHNLVFCHHFVIILSQFMMRRRKLYSDHKLNSAIGKYYHGTKKVIAVTESMKINLKSVEPSFQMIIDAC